MIRCILLIVFVAMCLAHGADADVRCNSSAHVYGNNNWASGHGNTTCVETPSAQELAEMWKQNQAISTSYQVEVALAYALRGQRMPMTPPKKVDTRKERLEALLEEAREMKRQYREEHSWLCRLLLPGSREFKEKWRPLSVKIRELKVSLRNNPVQLEEVVVPSASPWFTTQVTRLATEAKARGVSQGELDYCGGMAIRRTQGALHEGKGVSLPQIEYTVMESLKECIND